jgi:predicted permease
METLIRDVRYAFVTMRRARGTAAAAILTLALGIGATTAVFCVAYGVLWRPLPYADSGQLVRIWEEHPGGVSPAGNRWISNHTYALWNEAATTISGLGGYSIIKLPVVLDDGPVKLMAARVSPSVLQMLGWVPALGRSFVPGEGHAGSERVAILSHRLWRDRFRSDPSSVGRSITIDSRPHTIVGIAKPAFAFPDASVQFWIPYALDGYSAADRTVAFTAVGMLRPGVTPRQAESEGTTVAQRAPRHPLVDFFFGKGGPVVIHVRPLIDDMTATVQPALVLILVAIGMVLLISCANVANLMLVRGIARRRELAIRAALGSGRAQLFRQLLTESVIIAIAGGVLGLLFAWWLVRLAPAIAPGNLPRLNELRLDSRVLAFCAAATILAMVAAGVLPAIRGVMRPGTESLRDDSRTSSQGWRARRLSAGLLLAEAAFSTVLAIGAALMIHSFIRLTHVDPGYTADRVLTASIELPTGTDAARTAQFIDAFLPRLRARADVVSAGGGNMIPLMRRSAVAPIMLPPEVAGGKAASGRVLIYSVAPGYIETLGIRLREGRLFTERDGREGRRVILVNDELVRRHVASTPVVGTIVRNLLSQDGAAETEIVGVVGNVLKDGNDREPQPEIYVPHRTDRQEIVGAVQLAVRTAGPSSALAAELRNIVHDLEPFATVDRVEPLTTTFAASVEQPRFAAGALSAFALTGLLLAAIGLHGVLAYTVSQRRRELGVRAALGARPRDLVRLVLREGVLVTAAGVALGAATAAILARSARALLFGIAPLDVTSFAIGPAVLMVVVVVACLRPAISASSTDPALVLRGE